MLDVIIAVTPTSSPLFNTVFGAPLGAGVRFTCPPWHDLVTVSTVPLDGQVRGAGRYFFPRIGDGGNPEVFWVNYPIEHGRVDAVCVHRDLAANDPDFIGNTDSDDDVAKLWAQLFDMVLDAWRKGPIVACCVPRWDRVEVGRDSSAVTLGRVTWPDPDIALGDVTAGNPHATVVSGSVGYLFSTLLDVLAAVTFDATRGSEFATRHALSDDASLVAGESLS